VFCTSHSALSVESRSLTLLHLSFPAALLVSGQEFSSHFAEVFKPLSGEYDLIGRYPQAQNTVRNTPAYQNQLEELRSALTPELELIESRIAGPVKELQGIMKTIRKAITKREHKVIWSYQSVITTELIPITSRSSRIMIDSTIL
jgi:hypothetical protein